MDKVFLTVVVVPGIIALILFLVFTYLYEQSRQAYFRAWQLGWAAYTLHYGLNAWGAFRSFSLIAAFLSSFSLLTMGLCIFVSTRLMRKPSPDAGREKFRLRPYELGLWVLCAAVSLWNVTVTSLYLRVEMALAVILLYCTAFFYREGRRRKSLAFTLLAISLALWAVFMAFGQARGPYFQVFGLLENLLGPAPQMLLGIAMVMVLFENERNALQENALAFSTLGVDPARLLSAADVAPNVQNILSRLTAPLPTNRAMICFSQRWRNLLPSVQQGFSPEFLQKFESSGAAEYVSEMAYRREGYVTFHNLPDMTEPLPAFPGAKFEQFQRVLGEQSIRNLTAVSLQTRENHFGVILFPHAERRMFGPSNLRLLIGLALQLGLTIENYVVMHDAQRRTKEYELLTEIGQAISSRLNQDEILRSIQEELGQIFDTSWFYVAFLDGDVVRFELETENNIVLPKRSRKLSNGFTEYIVRTGQPLLIQSDLEKVRERLGVTFLPSRPAKSFCGVPIFFGGKPAGVMAALTMDREYGFEPRDLQILKTAAGQVSVAIENARLFGDEQRRSRQLAFLNNVSKAAISSDDSEQMLKDIVGHIQKNFHFDHIGIGLLDYATKDIEIKAEAGTTADSMGKRIPLGVGIVGRVARTGESALVQTSNPAGAQAVLPEAHSILCIPINYGETLMGILNIESVQEDAFVPQDVLILSTLADLLATALHNSFVFQKLQQQSITDGLTGIKTRRFFWEALSSEWKRASRSGRPFSVVLLDLDKFKEVNDGRGHLEGDLVLARVGRLLEQKCRQSNVVARYGGDEFIILMPETGAEQAQILAERLRQWLATDPTLMEHRITGSFGVASFPVHGFSAENIIRVADAGMYVSKRAGGNRVSSADGYGEDETAAVQRQLISGFIEGFLQREQDGTESMEELRTTLKKLCGGEESSNVDMLREAIESLTHASELRELNGGGHGELVARYCQMMARTLELPPTEIAELTYAARVHDVGKLFIPERILNKPGTLTDGDFEVMKTHSWAGAQIVATIPGSEALQDSIHHHHEFFDGSGYPSGLRGEEIPLWARIMAIADAYVNMTTERSFAPTMTSEQAMTELSRWSGTRYDGMLVRILARELKPERAASN